MWRIDEHRKMHERVDAKLTDELADHGEPGIRVDEIHLFKRADWVRDVASEQDGDLGREPARDFRAERIGDAGNEDTVRSRGGGYPLNLKQLSRSPDSFRAFPG